MRIDLEVLSDRQMHRVRHRVRQWGSPQWRAGIVQEPLDVVGSAR